MKRRRTVKCFRRRGTVLALPRFGDHGRFRYAFPFPGPSHSHPTKRPISPSCAEFRSVALRRGIPEALYDRAFRGLTPDPEVIEKNNRQPEFVLSASQYVTLVVTDNASVKRRSRQAVGACRRPETNGAAVRGGTLRAWRPSGGLETLYGKLRGKRKRHPLAVHPGLQGTPGKVRAQPVAGGPRHTQGGRHHRGAHDRFMGWRHGPHAVHPYELQGLRGGLHRRRPSRHLGQPAGRRLASAAKLSARQRGGFRAGPGGTGSSSRKGSTPGSPARRASGPSGNGRELGLRRAGGGAFPHPEERAFLDLPAGIQGPAFLLRANFRAIMRYNPAHKYALAVGHLSDRCCAARNPLSLGPTASAPSPNRNARSLQRLLAAQGYDIGEIDGIIGPRTRAAIRDYQAKRGRARGRVSAAGDPGVAALRYASWGCTPGLRLWFRIPHSMTRTGTRSVMPRHWKVGVARPCGVSYRRQDVTRTWIHTGAFTQLGACPGNTLVKMRRTSCCRQGATTSSGHPHARRSNAADGQEGQADSPTVLPGQAPRHANNRRLKCP